METIKIEKDKSNGYKVYINKYNYFFMWTKPGNCRFVDFDAIGNLITVAQIKQLVKVIKVLPQKHLFNTNTIGFSINQYRYEMIEMMKEHFDLIYCVKIPYSYNNGHQYHATFSFTGKDRYYKRLTKEKPKLV